MCTLYRPCKITNSLAFFYWMDFLSHIKCWFYEAWNFVLFCIYNGEPPISNSQLAYGKAENSSGWKELETVGKRACFIAHVSLNIINSRALLALNNRKGTLAYTCIPHWAVLLVSCGLVLSPFRVLITPLGKLVSVMMPRVGCRCTLLFNSKIRKTLY